MARQLTLSGSTLRPQSAATKAAIASRLRGDLWPALGAPNLPRPRIARLPLTDASAAHTAMEARSHIGKLVLITGFGAARA
jgi:NADPH2:quinone reductase